MKKVKVCVIAFAAMAMAMVSCNKEEAAAYDNMTVAIEQNEIMSSAKTHFEGDEQFWDDNDRISLWDNNGNGSFWRVVDATAENIDFAFVQNVNSARPFDQTAGPLAAFYPTSIKHTVDQVCLPAVQTSHAGELRNFPMYGKGEAGELQFKNICGIVTLSVSGTQVIDSIAITTDKRMNGYFSVNADAEHIENPLSYTLSGNHGTNTAMLKFTEPLQLTSQAKEVNMYIPAFHYEYFNITFYSNGMSRTYRNIDNLTVYRTHYTTFNFHDMTDFTPFVYGTTGAKFSLGDGNTCYVAKGNLTYIGQNFGYWRIADHGFDFVGTQQIRATTGTDRDIFAWGANGYKYQGGSQLVGNGIGAGGTNYYGGTTLEGSNDWANNNNRNADLNLNWKTPSYDEMNALLTNNTAVSVTVMGVEGVVLIPANAEVPALSAGAELTKTNWNVYDAAGCAFFPNTYHRNWKSKADGAYYWTSTANSTSAYIWDLSTITTTAKSNACFVRMIAYAE